MLELEEEVKERIREIDEEIRKLESKYGMNYKEFYNHVESNMRPLLEKFDLEEVMDDLEKLIRLLDEKERFLRKLGVQVDLFSELDEGWERVFP